MADRIVAERHVVAVGDYRLVALAHGERDEVVRLAIERGRDARGDGGDHAFEVE